LETAGTGMKGKGMNVMAYQVDRMVCHHSLFCML